MFLGGFFYMRSLDVEVTYQASPLVPIRIGPYLREMLNGPYFH